MTPMTLEALDALREECGQRLKEYRVSRTEAAAAALAASRNQVLAALQQWWAQGCR